MKSKKTSAEAPRPGKRRKNLDQQTSPDLEALIRRRAFQIYQHRGTPGDAVNDWHQAEAEIRAQMIDSGLEDM